MNKNEEWPLPLKVHPLADAFPLLPDDELGKLAESMAKNGLRHPIVIFEEQILDGRNRFRAADLLGIELDRDRDFEVFAGDWDDAVELVMDMNLRRRDLTYPQKLAAAARLSELSKGRPRKNPPRGGFTAPSMAEVAKKLGVGERSIQRHRKVQRAGAEELVEAVESGTVPLKVAEEISKLNKHEQREALAKGDEGVEEALEKAKALPPVRELSDVQRKVRSRVRADNLFAEMAKLMMTVKSFAAGLAECGVEFTPDQRELGRDFGAQLVTTGEWVQTLFSTEGTEAGLEQLLNGEK